MPFPSKRTPEIETEVLRRMSEGEPLAVICRGREDMPSPSTWREWCRADDALEVAHARAREDGHDALAAQCLEIADNTQHDTIETEAGEKANAEWISRSKLRVETRLKLLACWDPKRYGSKVDVAHSGGVKFIPMQPGDDDL